MPRQARIDYPGLLHHILEEIGRTRVVSTAKALFIYTGVEYLGKSTRYMAGLTKMSEAAASKARRRGQRLFQKGSFGDLLKVN